MDISFNNGNEKFNYRVCAMIINEGKILAMKDNNSPYYYLPGGRVKIGETAEHAVLRECKEELAVTVAVSDVFMEVVHEYPDITVHLTLFNASIADGVPQKLEHNDIKWITPHEISMFDFCPADKEILERIIEKYNEK